MIKNLHKKKLIGSVNNQLGVRKLKKKIIIYVGDEVFSGSAGTPRQTRQIENFLKTHKDYDTVNIKERVKKFFSVDTITLNKYGFTLTPDIINSDGYFISILRKSI